MASRYSEASADDTLDRVREICRLLRAISIIRAGVGPRPRPWHPQRPAGMFVVVCRVTGTGVLILRVIDGRKDYPHLFRL